LKFPYRRAAALLERQGILPGVMREKEWRSCSFRAAPEDAARHAEVFYHNTRPAPRADAQAMTDELVFKVVRINGTYEVLSRCVNLIIARGAYREAARMYPDELIELRRGARLIEKSK
jgi:hypothetical protein